MATPLFSFTPIDSFDIPSEDEGCITVSIDASSGSMMLQAPEQDPISYPLIDDESEPLPRVIFIDAASTPKTFQIGEVTYSRSVLDIQYFPLNGYDISFSVNADGGHLGILDIRDIAKELPRHHYYFDLMSTVLSIEGNHLTVKTLQWTSSDPYGPWHLALS